MKSLGISLVGNKIENPEFYKYLRDNLLAMSNGLENLKLNLRNNNLGDTNESLQYLAEGLGSLK